MPRIFISYRRSDSLTITGRIYDRLVRDFGEDSVFLDFDDIPFGVDFREVLEREVGSADILLVIIGPTWANVTFTEGDKIGTRRLDDPDDYVRIEVETALRLKGKLVIPVLVSGASMPAEKDVPSTLRRIAYNNAATVRDGVDFHHDMSRLIEQIQKAAAPKIVQQPQAQPSDKENTGRGNTIPAVLVLALIAVIVLAAVIFGPELFGAEQNPTETVSPSSTPTDRPGTPTALAQLDITATEAMLQRTVDAHETENALLAQNTEIAAQTQTAAAPTATDVPTDISIPTMTVTPTSVPPTPTPQPTATPTPFVQPIASPTLHYPCEGTIVSDFTAYPLYDRWYHQMHPSGSSISAAEKIIILTDDGTRKWYQISYNNDIEVGWIEAKYVKESESCSI